MFQHHVVRGFRAGIKQTFSFALRYGRFATIACGRLPLRSQEHFFHANVTRRSFLNAAIQVHSSSSQPVCSARYLSTSSRRLSEDGDLVYTGNLARAVLGAKFFCYSTSCFNLCVMPYILLKSGFTVKSLALKLAFCSFIGVFTFLTPVLLHLVTKGYVLRLYHNPATDTYTAVTYNVLLNEKRTVFHQNDVKIPDIHRMFTTFCAGKMPLLVNPDLFPSPYDYNHLMGYDKPFAFDADDLDKPDKS